MEKELKSFNPIIIIIIVIIIASLFLILNIPKNQKEPEVEKLIHLKFEDQIKNNVLFSNINIDKKNDAYYITAKATNITANILKISPITITLDKQITLTSYIGDTLDKEESKIINIKTSQNLKNTKIIEINIKTQVQSWVFHDIIVICSNSSSG